MTRVLSRELDYPGRDGLYYHEGQPFTGVSYTVYPTGEVQSESEWRGGAEDGCHRDYTREGAIAEEGTYRSGFRHGVWRSWHPNGKLASEEFCEFGCALTKKRWDSEANLIEDVRLPETSPQFKQMLVYRKLFGARIGPPPLDLTEKARSAG
jgi:MORN repeat variant